MFKIQHFQKKSRIRAVLGIVSGFLPIAGHASLINPSFENPTVNLGAYTSTGIIGWNDGNGSSGVWHIPNSSFFQTNAPDGLQIGYSNIAFCSQQSTNYVGTGTNTVSVQAGRRHDSFAGSFTLKVYAGGTVNADGSIAGGTLIASAPFDHTTIPIDSFTLITASYTAAPNDPLIGQPITIQLARTSGQQMNFDDVKISSPNADTVAPSSFALNLGKVSSGDAASLALGDGVVLTACKFFVPNQTSPFVSMTVSGSTTLVNPVALRLRAISKMVTGGTFVQTIKLFNFTTNAYEETRTDPITVSYFVYDFAATGLLSRYVGASGALQAQIQIKQAGFSASVVPCVSFDLVNWILVQ